MVVLSERRIVRLGEVGFDSALLLAVLVVVVKGSDSGDEIPGTLSVVEVVVVRGDVADTVAEDGEEEEEEDVVVPIRIRNVCGIEA